MTGPSVARPFDVCGPLPTGTTVLEASAGTGKTYTIAALAARYVAEGMPLSDLLLVTFTRMATGELRERVRERLLTAERALAAAGAGTAPDPDDRVAVLLATGEPAAVAGRRARLRAALADFDAATITTTHGFCQEELAGLGVAGDLEDDCPLAEDVEDLLAEVVDDFYIRRFGGWDGAIPFGRAEALTVARLAARNPGAPIVPVLPPEDLGAPALRARLADAVRRELERRKRRLPVITFDDLLTRLDEALQGDDADVNLARLRNRHRVVLVDEFQDTDPLQWKIVRRAFGDGPTTLVLIGDPKQAIYAFRGADVHAYLQAAATAGELANLETNWRSDQGLIDAYEALFSGARLGHPGIVHRYVKAAPGHAQPRLLGAPDPAPLRIRVVDRGDPAITRTGWGFASKPSAREHIARDLAADVVGLLGAGARVRCRRDGASVEAPLGPGDLAVLVRTHWQAGIVRDALDAVGVPVVINGAGSVFASEAATEWLRLLEAVERPSSAPRARAAALTGFVGWGAARVATAPEEDWEDVHERLHRWSRILRDRGVASLTETLTLAERLPERVLRSTGGERRLTDLRHVGQLLHAAATADRLGTTALVGWLRRRIGAAREETGDEERTRRLESDAEAVQVLTIHRSKGLEFPVVYAPFLWEPSRIDDGEFPLDFHDPAHGDRRTLDVGLEGPEYAAHRSLHVAEQRGEDLRLAYVALTRARHQAVVWWAGSSDSRHGALTRLLFARDEDDNIRPEGAATPTDAVATHRFEALAEHAPGCVSVVRADPAPLRLHAPTAPAGPPEALAAARFDRSLDARWRRTSYSAMTAARHEPAVASEPDDVPHPLADEPSEPVGEPAPPGVSVAGLDVPSPMADLPRGTAFGTLVHGVLEAADFAAPDLPAELAARIAEVPPLGPGDALDAGVLARALTGALTTPLGPLLGGASLASVGRGDRLDELAFELPLAGGEDPGGGAVTPGMIAAVLAAHAPPGAPMAAYADRLGDPALAAAQRGYLTGSIDLVARSHAPDGTPRFAVIDYKTNWLAPPGEPLTLAHHRPEALEAEMLRAHYGLQALLYLVALHRYLRWRLDGYAPETHLAGVGYLFVRGMTGPGTPVVDGLPCGVFTWRPSGALVAALSDCLDAGGTA